MIVAQNLLSSFLHSKDLKIRILELHKSNQLRSKNHRQLEFQKVILNVVWNSLQSILDKNPLMNQSDNMKMIHLKIYDMETDGRRAFFESYKNYAESEEGYVFTFTEETFGGGE